jgi:predicted DNA-binding protein
MTVTLQLKPEVEERIAAEAKARGLSVETYILEVLEKEATNGEASFASTATLEEWKRAFREWVNIKRPAHPPLSDEAISRESIYREREDAQL